MIRVFPSSSITFFSELYDGSILDKEIVRKLCILENELCSPGNSVMANRSFAVESDLKELKVNLNIPCFLGGRAQLKVHNTDFKISLYILRSYKNNTLKICKCLKK